MAISSDVVERTIFMFQVWLSSHRQQLAYGLSGFAASLLTTLFGLFNVALFLQVVHLNPTYFYSGHVIYALWNAINDPAFGWLIDKTQSRLSVIQYGGPLWCVCFLVTWFPWSYDGESWLAFAHFLFSMFCFDGFLTFVMIVKCALLADLCIRSTDRNELNNFSAWFSLAGSSLVSGILCVAILVVGGTLARGPADRRFCPVVSPSSLLHRAGHDQLVFLGPQRWFVAFS